MKLMRIGEPGAERPAALDGGGVMRDLSAVVPDIGPAFLAGDGLRQAERAICRGGLPEARGRIGAPIARPGKVVCIGLNYSDHAAETGQYMVLEPGDLLNTGTPAGVALGLTDQPYLRPGDRVELEIDLLGRAAQHVAAAT